MMPAFSGKVRDIYDLSDNRKAIVVSDRVSAFDFILGEVPGKGAVLNQIAAWWFGQLSEAGLPHHLLDVPHSNISVVKSAQVFPIEFVVRGYLTGTTRTSSWYAYRHLDRNICGIVMPERMSKNEPFIKPIITPTTKGTDGHDESISRKQILEQGIIPVDQYEQIENLVLEAFKLGQQKADELGLILVDTKYELGVDVDGEIMFVDEVHTPDSSRYWIKDLYPQAMKQGTEPESLDKEFVRKLVIEAGYDVDSDVNPRDYMTSEIIDQAAEKYGELRRRFLSDSEFLESDKNAEEVLGNL